ncbi:MFS transporter [Agromyces albus]|uniref:MFS transporter n=1 Tax=Agromyces albus TaxID=205332 RepID=UPI00278439F9|nr:MFS transporter [Agromyces albus]MDQ0576617.1 putative MFS family arabinose efflux permease [Agromyces albus]
MNVTIAPDQTATPVRAERLPWAALSVMALLGFVLISTETMPAGLLPQMAASMDTSEGTVGQFVSAYALGTVVATIPAITLTRGMRRKRLLLIGIAGFLVVNTVTALATDVALSLAARFVAGAFSGMLWGMLAGYALRITAPGHRGRALAIVSAGAPIGIALGTPIGSWVGTNLDWRWSFGGLSILTLILIALAVAFIPGASGQAATSRLPLRRVFGIPGIAAILAVVFVWMLAHSTTYIYIAPYLRTASAGPTVELALVVFGMASVIGIAVTGAIIDRHRRLLLFTSIALFAAAGVVLFLGHQSIVAVLVAITLWGITFGGAPAQMQAAMSDLSGENADVANAFLPVSFNLAIFAAGVLGAALVDNFDGLMLPMVMSGLAILLLGIAYRGRHSAFPAR